MARVYYAGKSSRSLETSTLFGLHNLQHVTARIAHVESRRSMKRDHQS